MRINVHLPPLLADYISGICTEETSPADYVRGLIQRDMDRHEEALQADFEARILRGYQDLAEGRYFASSGDFKTDMAIWERKRAEGWKTTGD